MSPPTTSTHISKEFKLLSYSLTAWPEFAAFARSINVLCAFLRLVEQGPMNFVPELLGPSTMNMTNDLYSHIVPAIRRETAAAMDRALG